LLTYMYADPVRGQMSSAKPVTSLASLPPAIARLGQGAPDSLANQSEDEDALRTEVVRWLRSVTHPISADRLQAWDDLGPWGYTDGPNHAEQVLLKEGFTRLIDRWERDNAGSVTVVMVHPQDGLLAEIQHWASTTITSTSVVVYGNYRVRDTHLLSHVGYGGQGGGTDGVEPFALIADAGVRVPLAAMRAGGQFVVPWQRSPLGVWLGGETAVLKSSGRAGSSYSDPEVDAAVRHLRQETAARIIGWPQDVHDLLGTVLAARFQ
jgi:hypothetical protein